MDETSDEMYVLKRDGSKEIIFFDKILRRIKKIGTEYGIQLNYSALAMKVIDQLYDGITTTQIDELTCEQCASMCMQHPDYGKLAGLISVSNMQKNTDSAFFSVVSKLYNFYDVNGIHSPLVSKELLSITEQYEDIIELMIDYERDYLIDFFGYKTLERAYLFRMHKKIVERPQHMWMRVAIGIHGDDMDSVRETYNLMSQKYMTHATPTLFNSGTPRPQLSSCYLLALEDDSVDGIYNTLKDCAKISKWAGGIGLHIHNLRASGSHIRGTNGTSNGLVPMLRVFNNTARYIDQGGGRRNGSFAIYLEPWHPDVEEFLEMRKNHGDEEMRARDLFYALWLPDLFMERVKEDGLWHYFCPDECPGLSDAYGQKFHNLYNKYVEEGKFRKEVNARELWFKILDSQMETGTPYILYKDAANIKSNQQNLGTIKSSNLCTEIMEYSDEKQTAVCNLASIALNKMVDEKNGQFNYEKLHEVAKVITRNLNRVIDVNFYPTEKTKYSNMLHRPIGIGVQGLADAFALMDIPYHSDAAKEINKMVFETIYHGAMESSMEISRDRCDDMNKIKNIVGDITLQSGLIPYIENDDINEKKWMRLNPQYEEIQDNQNNQDNRLSGAYSSFKTSPLAQGKFQHDLWNVVPEHNKYDWDKLRQEVMEHGVRNSLLIAPMPTASTSQILGNNECFEPITSNIYTRRTNAGEFIIINKHLMKELIELGLWSVELKNSIIENKGSIQHLDGLSDHMKNKYKTVWEIPMRHIIDMAKDRGSFICQSQSLNLWMEEPNYSALTSMHFYSWKAGLKTGIYYLRRKAKHQAQQFTIDPSKKMGTGSGTGSGSGTPSTSAENQDEECVMCSA
jgi:ribonucleoside-diphosphate reductase alpha chain